MCEQKLLMELGGITKKGQHSLLYMKNDYEAQKNNCEKKNNMKLKLGEKGINKNFCYEPIRIRPIRICNAEEI